METDSRSRRRTTRSECIRTGEANVHDLSDEVLELVLLRVGSPVSLIRAAATCRPWRRVIAGAGLLRRFDSLHRPHVLGHFYAGAGTAFVRSPAPPGEAAADVRRRVSLCFLHCHYNVNTLVLADCRGAPFPPSPASATDVKPCPGAFFLDADAGAGEAGARPNLSNFRVLCVFVIRDVDDGTSIARASVFSASENRWFLVSSTPRFVDADFVGRIRGSIFFWSTFVKNLVQLNEGTGAFSFFKLPEPAGYDQDWGKLSYDRLKIRVVGGDTGAVCFARIVGEDLEVLRCSGNGGAYELEKAISLSQITSKGVAGARRSWRFLDIAETVANHNRLVLESWEECNWMFFIDVETMEVERVQRKNDSGQQVLPYEMPWPPTINVCVICGFGRSNLGQLDVPAYFRSAEAQAWKLSDASDELLCFKIQTASTRGKDPTSN
ncbi:hypothetical protein ACP70R_032391 [Stipagrostis hirtigluma subsp. patula]